MATTAQANLDCDDHASAALHLAALLTIARETHDQLACAHGLEGVAELLAAADPERAVGLVATAARLRGHLGCTPRPRESARLDGWWPAARVGVVEAAATVDAEYASLPLAEALAEAMEACASAAALDPPISLAL